VCVHTQYAADVLRGHAAQALPHHALRQVRRLLATTTTTSTTSTTTSTAPAPAPALHSPAAVPAPLAAHRAAVRPPLAQREQHGGDPDPKPLRLIGVHLANGPEQPLEGGLLPRGGGCG
jgi:hypothetical protein